MIPLRDAHPTRRTPVVTLGLIAVCAIVFAWELGVLAGAGEAGLESFIRDHGVVPAEVVGAARRGDYLSAPMLDLLTTQFLHGGLLHVGGNMLYLWIFGNNIEDRFGRIRFLLFYLLGGAIAALAHVAVDPTSDVPLIGASGAIAATLGAYLVLFPRSRILSLVYLVFFYQLIQVPAVLVLGFWFVLQLIDGIGSLGVSAESGIAFFAHIGGFVFGAAIALVVRVLGAGPAPRPGVG